MTKEEILTYFKDINYAYNNCWRYDTLSRMLDELEQEPKADILDKIRAEMAELIEWHDCPIELDGGNDAWYCEAVNSCIAIIDMYRKEQNNADSDRHTRSNL